MEQLIDQIAGAHSQFEALRRDIAAQLEATADEQEQHSAARPQPLAPLPEGPDEVRPACALCVPAPCAGQSSTCSTPVSAPGIAARGLKPVPHAVCHFCAGLICRQAAVLRCLAARGATQDARPLFMWCCLLVGCMSWAVAPHPGLLSTGCHFTDVEKTLCVSCDVCWHTGSLIVIRTKLLAAGTVPCPAGDATGAPAQA